MRFVVGKNLLEAKNRAIDKALDLKAPLDKRNAAAAVELPEYLLVNHEELFELAVWRWGVPDGAYDLEKDGTRSCSVEFTYLLMARELEIPELALFAMALCGTYAIDTHDERGFVSDCMPQTSVEKLTAFLDGCPGAPGSRRAKQALRWVADSSASPMESCLTLLLCLPFRLGGFGLPLPELNARPDETTQSRALVGSRTIFGDLYWRDGKIMLEYDSDEEHTGSDRIAKDSKKRVVYAAASIQCITVTNEQVKDTEELTKVARLVARALGKRIRNTDLAFRRRHAALRERLLSFTRVPSL